MPCGMKPAAMRAIVERVVVELHASPSIVAAGVTSP